MVFGPRDLDLLRERLAGRAAAPWDDPDRRDAAVLAPLYLHEDVVHVVLTKKSDELRHHAGQMSFPGGSRDPEDASLLDTALREAWEEVRIRPDDVDVIGSLDDMPTAVSGFVIRPFIGVIPHPYELVPDGFEVRRVVTTPLHTFASDVRRRVEHWEQDGVRYPVYFFDDVDGEVVWGATARMLVGLVQVLTGEAPEPLWRPVLDPDGRS